MTYKEFAKFFSDNGLDIDKDKFKLGLDCYDCGDIFICHPHKNIYEHYVKGDKDNGILYDVYESEEECVAAMFAHIYNHKYASMEKINKETLREMFIKTQIDSFVKWLDRYFEKTGIKYVQYNTLEDYHLKPGECGIVFDNVTNEFVFACQDYPENENKPHSTFYTAHSPAISWLVKNEKQKLRFHLRKIIAVGTEDKRWTLYFDKLDSEIVYVFDSIDDKYNPFKPYPNPDKYILSQHPYGPTLYIDYYDKKIDKNKPIVIDGIGMPISLDSPQKEWQSFGNELFDILSAHKIIECPHCKTRWLFDDSRIPDGENYEITCKSCKKTITRRKYPCRKKNS